MIEKGKEMRYKCRVNPNKARMMSVQLTDLRKSEPNKIPVFRPLGAI
jgi:hypothetical protein